MGYFTYPGVGCAGGPGGGVVVLVRVLTPPLGLFRRFIVRILRVTVNTKIFTIGGRYIIDIPIAPAPHPAFWTLVHIRPRVKSVLAVVLSVSWLWMAPTSVPTSIFAATGLRLGLFPFWRGGSPLTRGRATDS